MISNKKFIPGTPGMQPMNVIDFRVHWQGDKKRTTARIFRNLFLGRVVQNKPCMIFIGGDSGEGKSTTAMRLYEILMEAQGLNPVEFINDCFVYVPLDYPKKMEALLHDPRLKKVNIIVIDEARHTMKAKSWHSFVNQAMADINATFRALKPMVVIFLSQFIRDVDSDMRLTINYYGVCSRNWHNAKFRLSKIWKDDWDINNPKLRKRKIAGTILKDGRNIFVKPSAFKIGLPNRELVKIYEENSTKAKAGIIRQKMQGVIKMIEREMGGNDGQVDALVSWYTDREHYGQLQEITEKKYGKIRLRKEVKEAFKLDQVQVRDFEGKLLSRLAEKGLSKGDDLNGE